MKVLACACCRASSLVSGGGAAALSAAACPSGDLATHSGASLAVAKPMGSLACHRAWGNRQLTPRPEGTHILLILSTPPSFPLTPLPLTYCSTATLGSLHVRTSARRHPPTLSLSALKSRPPLQPSSPQYRAPAQSHPIRPPHRIVELLTLCPHPGGSHPTAELTTVCAVRLELSNGLAAPAPLLRHNASASCATTGTT